MKPICSRSMRGCPQRPRPSPSPSVPYWSRQRYQIGRLAITHLRGKGEGGGANRKCPFLIQLLMEIQRHESASEGKKTAIMPNGQPEAESAAKYVFGRLLHQIPTAGAHPCSFFSHMLRTIKPGGMETELLVRMMGSTEYFQHYSYYSRRLPRLQTECSTPQDEAMAPKTRHLSAPSADTAVPLAPTRGVASAICSSQPASAQTRTSFAAWHGLFQTGLPHPALTARYRAVLFACVILCAPALRSLVWLAFFLPLLLYRSLEDPNRRFGGRSQIGQVSNLPPICWRQILE